MPEALSGKSATSLDMFEAFVKELDIVVAGWELKPCHRLEQD